MCCNLLYVETRRAHRPVQSISAMATLVACSDMVRPSCSLRARARALSALQKIAQAVQIVRSVIDVTDVNAGGWKNVGAPQVVWEGEAYKEVKVASAEILMIAKTPQLRPAGGAAVVAAGGASSSSAEVVSSPPLKPCVIQPCGHEQACCVWFWCLSLSVERAGSEVARMLVLL